MSWRIGLAALSLAAASPALAADCPADPQAAAQSAAASGDVAAMKSTFARLQQCNEGPLAQWLGRRIAGALYNSAIAGPKPDEAQLLSALEYGRPWQVLATLGDVLQARKDYAGATKRYQDALTEIDSTESTPSAPPPATILAVRKKAEQSGLLAASYVPTARTRDNRNAGLAAVSLRGVAIEAVALPVEFVFGKTEFTDKGSRAMADMIEFVNNQNPAPASVMIEGHTDPVGSDASNMALSLARARTVAQALRQGLKPDRVSLRIAAVGKGETQPYQPDDPSKFTQDELYQMSRRVELKRQ